MSWKAEVQADNTGTWAGNGLRFARKDEALDYVHDLEYRWTAVRNTRVVEVEEAASHRWDGGKAQPLEP